MPLARIQASIISNLLEMGQISEEQSQTIIGTGEDMSGAALETLLFNDYKIPPFQVLCVSGEIRVKL